MIIFTDATLANVPLRQAVEVAIDRYNPKAVFLREKELCDKEYLELAQSLMDICADKKVDLFICHRADIARTLGIKNLHISLKNLSKIGAKSDFDNISVAVHSVDEAKIAQSQGASSVVFGHIFETDCKKGLPPRGLENLGEICRNVSVPVVAIGGITRDNYTQVLNVGASDFAIMSSAMALTF